MHFFLAKKCSWRRWWTTTIKYLKKDLNFFCTKSPKPYILYGKSNLCHYLCFDFSIKQVGGIQLLLLFMNWIWVGATFVGPIAITLAFNILITTSSPNSMKSIFGILVVRWFLSLSSYVPKMDDTSQEVSLGHHFFLYLCPCHWKRNKHRWKE